MALTRINNQALTNVTSAGLPSGSVIQVQQGKLTSAFRTTSLDTYQDVGLSVTITPTTASSKIVIMTTVAGVFLDTQHVRTRLLRDSTVIQYKNYYTSDNEAWQACDMSMSYMDEPATTSAITYKIQGFQDQGTTDSHANWNYNAGTANMIAMEIAG